jgi:hypothetical protein
MTSWRFKHIIIAEMLTFVNSCAASSASGNAPEVYNTPPNGFLFPFCKIFLAPYKSVNVHNLVGTACYICNAVFIVQDFQG